MTAQEVAGIINEQMKRIHQVTGTRTQAEIADFLGVSQSAISDAKRREKIPAEWLITILRVKGAHPEWILTGNGSRHRATPAPVGYYETDESAQERRAREKALRGLSSKDLADELLRHIAIFQSGSLR